MYVSTTSILEGIYRQGTKRNKINSCWLIQTLVNHIEHQIGHSIYLVPLTLVQ